MKIPPPTRANSAIEEAPIPNVSIADIIASISSLNTNLSSINHTLISKRPRPTTVSPITAPDENAILSPLLSDSLAPLAVLEFAYVAIFIPINPERPEKKPPVINANGTNGVSIPVNARIPSITNITAKKIPTVLYCLLRYAIAPLRILALISAIFSVPSGFLFTE